VDINCQQTIKILYKKTQPKRKYRRKS